MPRKKATPATPAVHLRRMYADCRYGQMHLHSAFSGDGGFDELTTLVCLHPAAATGHAFDRLLPLMGAERSVYAPDLPGCGESDPPPAAASIAHLAAAVGDFIDHLRLRGVDLLGCGMGACVAAELAIERPGQVRRVVMMSVPVLTRAEYRALETARAPVPAHYAAAERLPRISQPVLVLRPRDALWEVTARARPLLPKACFTDLPEHGPGLLDLAPGIVASHLRAFLDGAPPSTRST